MNCCPATTHRARSLLTLGTQKECTEETERERGEHIKSSGGTLQFRSLEDVVHISSTPLPPCQMIPATFEPLLNTPVSCFHLFSLSHFLPTCSSRVEKQKTLKRRDQILSASPTTKDHNWIDWSRLGRCSKQRTL